MRSPRVLRRRTSSPGRITLHAGLPKTGTTSIQEWLRLARSDLARRGITVLVARRARSGAPRITVQPYVEGSRRNINSSGVMALLTDQPAGLAALRDMVDQVRDHAGQFGHVVLSGESFSELFSTRGGPRVLEEVNRFGEGHECAVVMYLRPQHSALEAAWRQWGFRSGRTPAAFLTDHARALHHWRRMEILPQLPDLDVRFRPFVRDTLVGGDAVRDFASCALGIDPEDVTPVEEANLGVSLTVTNLLATVPAGRLWSSPHDNRHFDDLKLVLRDLDPSDVDPDAAEGVKVLHRWAYDQFAGENTALLAELGWEQKGWPSDDGGNPRDISAIDELWRPSASPAELAVFHRLLEACSSRTGRRPGVGPN